MTPRQSQIRQHCYVVAGMLAPFIGGVTMLDTSDWRLVAAFFAGIILGGVNALRAYLDGSARDVESPKPEPLAPSPPPLYNAKQHSDMIP
jgi:hypothetical protein